ncbi:YdiY family protein [Burkholderiaceae bacterium UC74_6]
MLPSRLLPLLLLALAPLAQAIDVPPPPPGAPPSVRAPDGRWHGFVGLGGVLASGTTTTGTVNANVLGTQETEAGKLTVWGIGNYSAYHASGGPNTTTANSVRLGSRYDKYLTDLAFVFAAIEGETNRPQGLSSRLSGDLGAGYKVLRSETSTFDLFVGVGDTSNRFTTGSSAEGVQALFGEESTHKISATTSLRQRLAIRGGAGDVGSLATFDSTLATKLAGDWTLNSGFQARRTGNAPVGVKATTSLLTVGLGYKF